MGARRKARELALQMLFQHDMSGNNPEMILSTFEELEKSKQNIIRALPSMFGTNSSTAAAYADLALHGLPDNYYATYAAAIRKVTAKDVKAAAKTVVPTSKLVIAIVGDLSKIMPEVDKIGLGAPAMHDLYGMPIAKP